MITTHGFMGSKCNGNRSDGDGVNDSADDFPNDPCADTDTDGDGMPDTISCLVVQGLPAYTSLNPFTNGANISTPGELI